jgi:hypothetical protein
MPYTITASGPYEAVICRFIAQQFPRPSTDLAELVDVIEAELYGTKQVRYGPKPTAESQVAIRETIRRRVAAGQPIPIVVPWGSEKPDGSSIDLAELMAIRALASLHHGIAQHYSPGAEIRIRVEDVSAPHLFHWRADQARAEAAAYTRDLRALVDVLDAPLAIAAESYAVTEAQFNAAADARLSDFVNAVMLESTTVLKECWGWKGDFSPRMLDFYLGQYEKLYPTNTLIENRMLLARYLAGASARSQLGLRGDRKEWEGDYLEVSFVQPVPGTEGHFGKRVHYRTMPLACTSSHIPPWRAKGYFVVGDDDSLTPKVATFHEALGLTKTSVTLTSGNQAVSLRADILT